MATTPAAPGAQTPDSTSVNIPVLNHTHSDVASGQTIGAATFATMLNVLEALNNHVHTYYDDYTTVCECQCQCASNRGLL